MFKYFKELLEVLKKIEEHLSIIAIICVWFKLNNSNESIIKASHRDN